mmetsp:Transcript_31718/g.81250  ORF Transcript_31718/g.81250 Transcript_31718/m.81250 type:complete len:544 (+) Transcript_31718:108-1739(+)
MYPGDDSNVRLRVTTPGCSPKDKTEAAQRAWGSAQRTPRGAAWRMRRGVGSSVPLGASGWVAGVAIPLPVLRVCGLVAGWPGAPAVIPPVRAVPAVIPPSLLARASVPVLLAAVALPALRLRPARTPAARALPLPLPVAGWLRPPLLWPLRWRLVARGRSAGSAVLRAAGLRVGHHVGLVSLLCGRAFAGQRRRGGGGRAARDARHDRRRRRVKGVERLGKQRAPLRPGRRLAARRGRGRLPDGRQRQRGVGGLGEAVEVEDGATDLRHAGQLHVEEVPPVGPLVRLRQGDLQLAGGHEDGGACDDLRLEAHAERGAQAVVDEAERALHDLVDAPLLRLAQSGRLARLAPRQRRQVVHDLLVRVLHVHHKAKRDEHVLLDAHHLIAHLVVLLGVQLQNLEALAVHALGHAVKHHEHLPHVALNVGHLLQLGRQPQARERHRLHVVLRERSLAVEALQQHLPRAHHDLRELEADAAGLDDLRAVQPLRRLRLLVHARLARRRVPLECVIAEIEVVHLHEVGPHGHHWGGGVLARASALRGSWAA